MAVGDSTSQLYNEECKVVFRDGNHRYYVNGELTPSVTTIMGQVLAKPELMLWPLNLAIKHLQEKLPNITTADLEAARQAHVQKREKGSTTGTAVHYIVEKRLNTPYGQFIDIEDLPQEVALAALAFETWYRTIQPGVVATEQVVYSKQHKYVGTYDSILRMDGKNYLCDLKTTNAAKAAPKGIYAEHYIQLGAYYEAYEEQRQYEGEDTKLVKIDDLMVISAKKDGTVDTQTISSLGLTPSDAAAMWRSVHHLYVQLAYLKKKIQGGSP
jgi:hypothetical protein